MVHSRFKDKTKIPPQQSGISDVPIRNSELPSLLEYPKLLDVRNAKDLFSYILKHPGDNGLSLLLYREPKKDQAAVICGDWSGNSIDLMAKSPLADLASDFLKSDDALKLFKSVSLIGVEQAQFFFGIDDEGLFLVDVQVSLNKFVGPGMIQDIFGKLIRTQEVLKIEIIDERSLEYIERGTGSYEGDLLIKPSKFRMYHDPDANVFSPLYSEVRR